MQMPLLKQTLDHMGIQRLELAGWEADDLLGTVARRCEAAGWACEIVTGDKDSLQLITDTTHVCHVKTRMGQTETIEYTPEVFRAEYGFDPIHMIDLKALMGDSSDNIPGVPGIGEKTAKDLLVRFGTVRIFTAILTRWTSSPACAKNSRKGARARSCRSTLPRSARTRPLISHPNPPSGIGTTAPSSMTGSGGWAF